MWRPCMCRRCIRASKIATRPVGKTAKTKTTNAVRRIGLVLAATLLAWPILAAAHDASPLATVSPADSNVTVSPAPLAPLSPADQPRRANFLGEIVSKDARHVADWVVASADNNGLPFIVIDKVLAKVFVFDSSGRLRGATVALLGRARGDDTVPGIGNRKLSTIRPEERTTPAGRFVANLGHDFAQDILWIDYGAAISLHRVIRGNPGDHRLLRLSTASPLDKRISYGCINVPVKFYDQVVLKTFTGTSGIVYILPEVKTIEDVFSITGALTAPAQTEFAKVTLADRDQLAR